MSDAGTSPEQVAERIAERGREALVARLRAAYAEAASAHSDIVSIDEERIESMVQRAADRADGLQWRRALAEVAAEELGISVTDALSNPAVARAQEMVGAPSYEESLAQLIANPVPGTESDPAASRVKPAPAEEAEIDEPEAVAEAESIAAAETVEEPEAVEESETSDELQVIDESGLIEEPSAVEEAEVIYGLGPIDGSDPVEGPEVEEPDLEEPRFEAVAVPEAEASAEAEVQALSDPESVSAADAESVTTPYQEPAGSAHHEPMPTVEHSVPAGLGDGHPSDDGVPPTTETSEEVPLVDGEVLPEHVPEEDQLRVSAVHLGGVANLPLHEDGLDIRLSSSGLDIMHETDEIIGRLLWSEIDDLEVPETRGRFRRSRGRARLTVRTQHGDASFEIPAFSSDELRERVDELLEHYGRF